MKGLLAVLAILCLHGSPVVVASGAGDPFAWLKPAIVLDAGARARIERGEVFVRILPDEAGGVAVLVASRLQAEPSRLAAWGAAITELKKGPYVLAVRRFSAPPAIEDLDALSLDDTDLESLRRCTPGDCELKVGAAEIQSLRHAAVASGALWKESVQMQFRRIVLERVNTFLASGFEASPPNADRRKGVDRRAAVESLLENSPYLRSGGALAPDLPRESFVYWSKEHYGTGKSVVGVTSVDILRAQDGRAPQVAVLSTEVLATHYRDASLGLTAAMSDDRGQSYLVYVNRSNVDLLGGVFGGLKRVMLERRLKSESARIFGEVRRRLESGLPGDPDNPANRSAERPDQSSER